MTYNCVPGDGPRPSRVMCIGEALGREEDSALRPFIGQAGREFNENYLNLAGLYRDEVYVTNSVKCRPDLNRKPNPREVFGCSNYFLPNELAEVQPEVVMLMGATACSLIPGIDLEVEHGIPRWARLYEWEGWVVPHYHPASGLHDTAMIQPMLEDWEGLRLWLDEGKWMWAEDEYPERDYRLVDSWRDVATYMDEFRSNRMLAGVDTESHDEEPWSVQVSIKVGTGLLIPYRLVGALEVLAQYLDEYELVLHNAEADLDIVRGIGWSGRYTGGKYRDTMAIAYHLGNLRQGLKPLSRRLLGRSRLSWEETVTPYSKEVLAQWMCDGLVYAETNWQQVTPRFHKKTGKPLKPDVKVSDAERLLKSMYGHMLKGDEYPIWDKLRERMPAEWLDKLIAAVGPIPAKGIAHCPLDVAVRYGCSDADDTLALALKFDVMRKQFVEGLNLQSEDIDDCTPQIETSTQTQTSIRAQVHA